MYTLYLGIYLNPLGRTKKEREERERERERVSEIGDVIEEKRTYRIESFHESVKGNLLTFFTS